jgi:hypothetical protein
LDPLYSDASTRRTSFLGKGVGAVVDEEDEEGEGEEFEVTTLELIFNF